MENAISRELSITEGKATYDACCKRLLGKKVILAWILKYTTEEYSAYDVDEIAERYIEGEPQIGNVPAMPGEWVETIAGMGTEDSVPQEGTITYDIRFVALLPESMEQTYMIVNIEAQKKYNPGYPIVTRGIFYHSRMISSQYEREFTAPHYEKIKKVYSI